MMMPDNLSVNLPFVYRVRGVLARSRNETIEYYKDWIDVRIPIVNEKEISDIATIYDRNEPYKKIKEMDGIALKSVREIHSASDIEKLFNTNKDWNPDTVAFSRPMPSWERDGYMRAPIYPDKCKSRNSTTYKDMFENDYLDREAFAREKAKCFVIVEENGTLILYEGLRKGLIIAHGQENELKWNSCLFEEDPHQYVSETAVFVDFQDANQLVNDDHQGEPRWRIEMSGIWPMKRRAHIDNLENARDQIETIFLRNGILHTPIDLIHAWSGFSVEVNTMRENNYEHQSVLQCYENFWKCRRH